MFFFYACGIHSPWLITKRINKTATIRIQNTIKPSSAQCLQSWSTRKKKRWRCYTCHWTCWPSSKQVKLSARLQNANKYRTCTNILALKTKNIHHVTPGCCLGANRHKTSAVRVPRLTQSNVTFDIYIMWPNAADKSCSPTAWGVILRDERLSFTTRKDKLAHKHRFFLEQLSCLFASF